jgi:hypothetical protein
MSIAAAIAPAILDTVIGRIALLFLAGAGGDMTAARHAAHQMLAAYNPETPDELSLASEIVSFSFHALEALSYASNPDLSLNKVLRLRGSAVSLSRESHKAQRKLDQLQRGPRTGTVAQPPEAASESPVPQPQTALARPAIDNAFSVIEAVREAVQTASRTGEKNWTQSFQKRQTANRIAENLKKNQARHASLATPVNTSSIQVAASAA